jgi:hypothetical protein
MTMPDKPAPRIDISVVEGNGEWWWWFELTLASRSIPVAQVPLSCEQDSAPPFPVADPDIGAEVAEALAKEVEGPFSPDAQVVWTTRALQQPEEAGRIVHIDHREELRALVASALARPGTSLGAQAALQVLLDWIDRGAAQDVDTKE